MTLDGKERHVQVVATHLGLKPWERRQQVRQLLKLFDIDSKDIYVLLGDLNEWFLLGTSPALATRPLQIHPHVATYPSRQPFMALDRLWVHPRRRLAKLEVHASSLARIASDHLPLKGTIEI